MTCTLTATTSKVVVVVVLLQQLLQLSILPQCVVLLLHELNPNIFGRALQHYY